MAEKWDQPLAMKDNSCKCKFDFGYWLMSKSKESNFVYTGV